MPEYKSNGLGSLPRSGKYYLLLNVWYSESFVKEKQTPHFIFVVWSALVVNSLLMATWGRKSYLGPAEISSGVCTWLSSRMGDSGWFVCIASLAKSRSAIRESHQPVFMDSLLTIIYICLPRLPSRWLNPYMFCTSHSGASAGSFEDKIMLHCSAETKRQQGITTEIGYYVFDILGYSGDAFNDDGLVVGKVQFQCNLNLS